MNHLVSRQECARTPKEDLVVHPTVLLPDWSRWVLAKGTSNRSSRWRKRRGGGQDKFKSRTHESFEPQITFRSYIHIEDHLSSTLTNPLHGYTHTCHPLTYPMSVRIRQERVRFQKTREIYRPPRIRIYNDVSGIKCLLSDQAGFHPKVEKLVREKILFKYNRD